MTNNSSPSPRRHGGRRPGAGAPPGNINALKHARHSTRYADAQAFLFMLDVLRPAPLPADERDRRALRHRSLDAARWIVRRPMVFNYVREQVLAFLWSPECKLRRARLLEFMLTERLRSVTWTDLAGMVLYIRKRQTTFGDAFAQYLDSWFAVALESTDEFFLEPSPNNQTIKLANLEKGGKR